MEKPSIFPKFLSKNMDHSALTGSSLETSVCMFQQLKTALIKWKDPDNLFKMSNRKSIQKFDVSDAQLVPSKDEMAITSEISPAFIMTALLKAICEREAKDPKVFEHITRLLCAKKVIPDWIMKSDFASRKDILSYLQQLYLGNLKNFPCAKTKERYTEEYEEIKLLGEGGFASVYKALNKIDGRYYAIKKISVRGFPDSVSKIYNEVKTLAGLENPCIVRYYSAWIETCTPENNLPSGSTPTETNTSKIKELIDDDIFDRNGDTCLLAGEKDLSVYSDKTNDGNSVSPSQDKYPLGPNILTESDAKSPSEISMILCTTNGSNSPTFADKNQNLSTLFIQMELCKETLHEWLQKRNSSEFSNRIITDSRNWTIFQEMLKGVVCIHEAGIIHRDLKPSNIFLTDKMKVKIGDFGLATSIPQIEGNLDLEGNVTTPLSKGVGTAMYSAPEQKTGCNYDNKSDIYSLGLILYEMYHPFYTDFEKVKLFEELTKNRKISEFVMKNFPEKVNLILAMTDSDPTKRPTAKDVLEQVQPPSIEEIVTNYEKLMAEGKAELEKLKQNMEEENRFFSSSCLYFSICFSSVCLYFSICPSSVCLFFSFFSLLVPSLPFLLVPSLPFLLLLFFFTIFKYHENLLKELIFLYRFVSSFSHELLRMIIPEFVFFIFFTFFFSFSFFFLFILLFFIFFLFFFPFIFFYSSSFSFSFLFSPLMFSIFSSFFLLVP
ncbi:EIF2AK1 [Acanthosepion pharaonis]|uniref:non-specific serine/threonine protein kinase n=1 Tax=Acanthosepion pharaonis TaxID=158019 RepID=A0A812DLM3_ACAPH|nr:EIF2AK1 [Sepia pharaonis]